MSRVSECGADLPVLQTTISSDIFHATNCNSSWNIRRATLAFTSLTFSRNVFSRSVNGNRVYVASRE
ncbi:hypothetical protein M408DRAFT_123424 [Serendipita vermifera MAFF 305830]|uniref:Uncharacterized protein n=1 Tax=Serendipita vermifera MAFF 305830 TaxID=933852 RepID=A0A0C2W2T2_SERVB|nr:hypothetical protein M408DRAFT_123424 [Serendipita vermifera MAFF 305830]